MHRSPSTEEEEPNHAINRGDEPQEHINQIDPDGVFHPLDSTITFGVLMDIHFAEKTEEGDEEDTIHHHHVSHHALIPKKLKPQNIERNRENPQNN